MSIGSALVALHAKRGLKWAFFLGGRWDGVRGWLVREDSKQGKEAKKKEERKEKESFGGKKKKTEEIAGRRGAPP